MLATFASSGYGLFAAALVGLWLAFGAARKMTERLTAIRQQRATSDGHTEPVSLHPIIDPARCVGCGACTHACPEGRIIGMIAGKAELIDPGSCIGHGACKTACPVGAIDLVFGSATRGVDIPVVSSQFETNVPGVFVAGELGGMGLIANAVEQGRQAVDAIANRLAPPTGRAKRAAPQKSPSIFDVLIVGAGPAGIAATLAAKEKQLSSLTLEQDTLGGTVAHYPRRKIVMTRPASLPLYGKVRLRRVRKEKLIALWQAVIAKTRVKIHHGVRVERIARNHDHFEIATSSGPARARTILLATGRRGAPKKLGVPGEQLAKVTYRLDSPAQYRDQHILVVGGGDSALEAAIELARHPVASVTLVHRGASPTRARSATQIRFDGARRGGRVYAMPNATVSAIEPDRVIVQQHGEHHILANHKVIIAIGGTLPMELLSSIGVAVETKFGTA